MFYFFASKFITGNNFKSLFLVGSICYIILHAYLFSNNNNETIQKFRHYIYYLFLADAILTGSYIWLFGNSIDTEYEDTDENTDNNVFQSHQLPEINKEKILDKNINQESNIEEIHRKLLEIKARQELKLKQDISTKESCNESPFAKKDVNQNNVQQKLSDEDEDDNEINNEYYESHDSIPLYRSDNNLSDTDIPVYISN